MDGGGGGDLRRRGHSGYGDDDDSGSGGRFPRGGRQSGGGSRSSDRSGAMHMKRVSQIQSLFTLFLFTMSLEEKNSAHEPAYDRLESRFQMIATTG